MEYVALGGPVLSPYPQESPAHPRIAFDLVQV